MSRRKRLVEDTLRIMLSETTTILNVAKECLSAVKYAEYFPIKRDDVFYLTNTLACLKKTIIELSKQFKILESSKLTDSQSEDVAKIEGNIAMIIFTNNELCNIYTSKDNVENSLRPALRELIQDVMSGKVKLFEDSKETEAFYAMIHSFFDLPPELLKKLEIDGLVERDSFNIRNWN